MSAVQQADNAMTKDTMQMRSAGRLGQGASATGQVQKAMGANPTIDAIWDDFCELQGVKEEFAGVLAAMPKDEEKVVAVSTLVPLLKKKIYSDPEGLARKRAGVLEGYRSAADKHNIPWRQDMVDFAARGMDVWEQERQALEDKTLAIPDYYVYGGVGPLHSYAAGNCNWEAAFDVKAAFELVHMHHFPELSPADCMAELHRRMDDAAIAAVRCEGPVTKVVDVGCGVGTSTFSLRRSLDRHGFKDASVLACDLSTHFLAVGRYRQLQGDQKEGGWDESKLRFAHGDGLQLRRLGFGDASAELVMLAKVSHETPTHANYMQAKEAARVLRPGGVIAYVDINPAQILGANPVSNIANRVAMSNEPFFDQFISCDMHDVFRQAGMEVLSTVASNPDKWPQIENAPVRIMIARKPLPTP